MPGRHSAPISVLAFLSGPDHLRELLERAKGLEPDLLILVQAQVFPCEIPKLPFPFRVKTLSCYRPIDLEQQVLSRITRFIAAWHQESASFFSSLRWRGYDLGNSSHYAMATLLHPVIRLALTMQNAVVLEKPDAVIATDYLGQLCKLAEIETLDCHVANSGIRLISAKWARVYRFICWCVVGFSVCLVLSVSKGWLWNACQQSRIDETEILVVGALYHLRGLNELWSRLLALRKRFLCLRTDVLSPDSTADEGLIDNWSWLAGCVTPHQVFGIMWDQLGSYAKYLWIVVRRSRWDDPLLNSMWSVLGDKIDRFIALNLPEAMLCATVADRLASETTLHAAIFSVPNSWGQAVMAQVFRRNSITTASFVHGMVLDPIDYRSQVDVKVTWSPYDANILRTFSDDREVVALDDGQSNAQLEANDLLAGKHMAVLLPSAPLTINVLSSYLQESLDFIGKNKDTLGIDCTIIKPHPRSKMNDLIDMLKATSGKTLDLCQVQLWQDSDLSELLCRAKLVLCTPSSVMVDCLRRDVPFVVFDLCYMGGTHFLSMLPEWMRYQSARDLERSLGILLSPRGHKAVRDLKDSYWGKEATGLTYGEISSKLLGPA